MKLIGPLALAALNGYWHCRAEAGAAGPEVEGSPDWVELGQGLTDEGKLDIMNGLSKMDRMDEIMEEFERIVAEAKVEQEIAITNRASLATLDSTGETMKDMDGVGDRLERAILAAPPDDTDTGDAGDGTWAIPGITSDWAWTLMSIGLAVLVGLWSLH